MSFEHDDFDRALEDELEWLHALGLEQQGEHDAGYDHGPVSPVAVEGPAPNAGTASSSDGTIHACTLWRILCGRLWWFVLRGSW